MSTDCPTTDCRSPWFSDTVTPRQGLPMLPGETPEQRCAYYGTVCGLPAVVDHAVGRIVLTTGEVGAIILPSGLGRRVRSSMLLHHSEIGPIINHPRSQRWTYIVRPDIDPDVKVLAELFRSYVSVSQHGGQVALPSPVDSHMSFRVWEEVPTHTFRPSGAEIVALIRKLCGHDGGAR